MVLKFMCILRPQKGEVLCQSLLQSGLVHDIRVVEILGRGKRGIREKEQGQIDYLPKVSVTLYAEESDKDAVIELINSTCRSGRIGDGKIFVSNIERIESF